MEAGSHEGLGLLEGTVDRLKIPEGNVEYKLPHIGWNDVAFRGDTALYRNLGNQQTFYFANSYALTPRDGSIISGTCEYGETFVASIEFDNLYAVQFHPEKSHKAGLRVLRNWCDIVERC